MDRTTVRRSSIFGLQGFIMFLSIYLICSCELDKGQVNVLDFKGSTSNDTEMIRKAIDHAANKDIRLVYVPGGRYKIDALQSINLRNNIHLKLADEAVLEALPNDNGHYAILAVHHAVNVKISGGKIVGERADHTGKGGEWGMGIDLRNTKNVEIEDIHISDCWGDAIYIGKGTNEDVKINNVVCDNNRRQGISITRADGVNITNSFFMNTHGTKPESGIDLEPNSGDEVKNVTIADCEFKNNAWSGINMYTREGLVSRVVVESCTFTDNPDMGIQIGRGNTAEIAFRDIGITGSSMPIKVKDGAQRIKFTNVAVSDYTGNGVYVYNRPGRAYCRDIEFTNCSFQSANGKDAVLIDNARNITFSNNTFQGDLFSKDNTYSYLVLNGASRENTVSNNTIESGSGDHKARYGICLGDSAQLNTISGNQIESTAYTESAIRDESTGENRFVNNPKNHQ